MLPAASETCGNMVDDDCNGMVDDMCGECTPGAMRSCYSGPSGAQSVGACRAGSQTCGAGRTWGTCTGEVVPVSETCNLADDNCNAMVDEDPAAAACRLANATPVCRTGACAVGTCAAGFGDCDAAASNGCETELASSSANCGLCGRACAAGQTCVAGNRAHPALVPGLSTAIDVELGATHSCAVRASGEVSCWGVNAQGQLGDSTVTQRALPVTVFSLATVASITAGNYHTCARLTDGTMYCWGYNASGQVGDGWTVSATTPQGPVFGLP